MQPRKLVSFLFLIMVAKSALFSEVIQAAQATPGLDRILYANDDLGAVYTPQATTIKLWAPTAEEVSLVLFSQPKDGAPTASETMLRDGDGIWSATLQGDQEGRYYLYEITHQRGDTNRPLVLRVNDPYARGCSVNSGRTLIYDPRKTDPDGWSTDRFLPLNQNVDAVLYEAHIRDFSIHKTSGTSSERRGKYLGMVEEGTRSPNGERTGLDHLKDLGITHVHLLPTFDYANGDESQTTDSYTWYNWGYDPVLYNTPEGSYASDPNGTARQKEFKRMVQAFHRANIGVVFDAVFNHTAATGLRPTSIFDKVVPGYYYRLDPDGRYVDSTFCGNELASEKPMVRNFIVDSVKYWMREYHIDGFRFDLMGIEDRETMLEVYREAKEINPNALIYGEGWNMERLLPPERMMTQANVKGTGLAAFNDGIRDNIKGAASRGEEPGFVQGANPRGGFDQFLLNIKGQSTDGGIAVSTPNEVVNYASAHDDHCLWDKLLLSAAAAPESLRINMDKLAMGIVLTSQGVPFLHAGDEFLRSKNKVKNSYNSNDPLVNPIDWNLKSKNKAVFEFYRGMIALRRAHPAFRMTDKLSVDKSAEFLRDAPNRVVAFMLRNNANGDSWKNILVAYNGTAQEQELTVAGSWTVVANDKKAGVEPLETVTDKVRVAAASLVVAHSGSEN
jgi:pullulanase